VGSDWDWRGVVEGMPGADMVSLGEGFGWDVLMCLLAVCGDVLKVLTLVKRRVVGRIEEL